MDAIEQFETFRQRRRRAVLEPKGNLALVATHWVEQEQKLWNVPGVWSPLSPGHSGLQLEAKTTDNIRLNGELVDGRVVVNGKDSDAPGELTFSSTVSGFVIAGHDKKYALRVWDSESDAVKGFEQIDTFPYNPDWVLEGKFTEKPGATLPFEHSKDEGVTRVLEIPGDVSFSYLGQDYSLAAIRSGKALQLVYSDATSGNETYGVGRFLFVVPRSDGSLTLDFNNGILPPCAFSYAFNCPMPPAQNRLKFPIEAGEKNVIFKGSLEH